MIDAHLKRHRLAALKTNSVADVRGGIEHCHSGSWKLDEKRGLSALRVCFAAKRVC